MGGSKIIIKSFLKRSGQKLLVLIDSCSAHGNTHSLPTLSQVEFYFLNPIKTSSLQLQDVGIIASVKLRFHWLHLERGADLADVSVDNTCEIDIFCAMRWLSSARSEVTDETILIFRGNTGILSKRSLLSAAEDR